MVAELEIIQKVFLFLYLHHSIFLSLSITQTVTDEVSLSENIRQVLKVESKIEGGCEVLLDKEQALVKKGTINSSVIFETSLCLSFHLLRFSLTLSSGRQRQRTFFH